MQDGEPVERTYSFYARDLERDPKLDMTRLQNELGSRGMLRTAICSNARVTAVDARSIVDVTREMLTSDPDYLLADPR